MTTAFEKINLIRNFARDVTRDSLKSFSGKDSIGLSDWQAPQSKLDRMGFVIASDWGMKISLRAVFSYSDAAEIGSIKGDPYDPAVIKKIIDFIKEFCNLSGGVFIRGLETTERPMGLSIPVSNKVVDEVVLPRDVPPQMFHDGWVLQLDSAKIYCLLAIEFSDPQIIENLSVQAVTVNAADSDLEFL
jgi:hypothetical protein